MIPKIICKIRYVYHTKMVWFWGVMYCHGAITRHTVETKTLYHAFAALTDARRVAKNHSVQ